MQRGGVNQSAASSASDVLHSICLEDLESELAREQHRARYGRALRTTIGTLLVVAALAVLVASLWLPVMRIYGGAMVPTLNDGEIAVSVKSNDIRQGDIVGVYYGSKLLVRRCIATSGQMVDISESGEVSVDGVVLDEPYVMEKAKGDCDLELPFQVPENTIFVLGDSRASSIDSRLKAIGCISEEDVAGKIFFRVWPFESFGLVN